MVNYNNGKIYKIEPICDHDEGDIYIGSTTKQYLSQRMEKHRSYYRLWLKGKVNNVTSFQLFEKYGVENCQIILLESVNVNSKDELHSREAHYIKSVICVNKVIPLRSKKEYREKNKPKVLKDNKIYKDDNKERLNKKYECECGGKYTYAHKAYHFKTEKHCKFINEI